MCIRDRIGVNVVPISNFNTLQLRSLIKDIGKFYDIPFTEVNKVTGVMMAEATPLAKKAHGQTAGVYTPTFDEVKEYSETLQAFFQKYQEVATHVDHLFGICGVFLGTLVGLSLRRTLTGICL